MNDTMNDTEIVVVIPARGGSKTVPKKNIRNLAGKPLLAYSIVAGKLARSVKRVIVSTDDEEIAQVAKDYGAEVPFLRPKALAQDETIDFPVFRHALEWLRKNESYRPDIVVQLRPTSPLRPPDCVDQAIEILRTNQHATSVRAVIPASQNPFKMWRIKENGSLEPLLKNGYEEPYNMPRQKLPQTYWQTGHIDVIRTDTIESGSMSGSLILPLFMDPLYAVDIDTERDHQLAEWLIHQGDLPLVLPGKAPRAFPAKVELLLLDFDGVLTDNRVWVDSDGRELIAANRSDGWGIARLKDAGVRIIVLSTETNPVVQARCQKLGIEVFQGLDDKAEAVKSLIKREEIESETIVYVGNDENDLPAFPYVGYAIVVGDAHPRVKEKADLVLVKEGGYGAVREVCDRILLDLEGNK
jgi:N-acylneuraminate cytidylyltransferase